MSKRASYTLDGWIAEDFYKHMEGPDGVDHVLKDIGEYGVPAMRNITSESDVSKRLSKSLMYITNKGRSSVMRSKYKQDTLEAPSEEHTVLIGSGAPHALYRETYSGTHLKKEGSKEFVGAMKQWCWDVLNINADGPPEDREAFYLILRSIRDDPRTEGKPFILPNIDKITKYGLMKLKQSLRMFLNSKAHKEG